MDTNGWVFIRNRRARTRQDGEQKSGKRARTRQESTSKLASGSSDDSYLPDPRREILARAFLEARLPDSLLAEAMAIEASTVAFLVLLTLSAWKVVEVIAWVRQHTQLRAPTPVRAMPQPVPKPLPKRKPVRGAGEVLTQAEAHALEVAADYLRRIEFLQTREGNKLHLRGCQHLRGSEGDARHLCFHCSRSLERALKTDLEVEKEEKEDSVRARTH